MQIARATGLDIICESDWELVHLLSGTFDALADRPVGSELTQNAPHETGHGLFGNYCALITAA